MLKVLAVMTMAGCAVCSALAGDDLPTIEVDRDNIEVRESARVVVARDMIADEDGDGVIHIIGDDLVIDFSDVHLRGAPESVDPDEYSGIGVRITGSNNTIRGGRFSGFKFAIYAEDANGLTVEDVDVSDNFRQRLRSTPEAASETDALNTDENDDGEWLERYGAGIAVARSENVTIRRARARAVQNGIVLDRVSDSRIYDNDCSFLSGWGLAMWRSSRNAVTRNAFDFCVRGHAEDGHGSAGILLVEQSSQNIIAENSLTHGGIGIRIHAGPEALGEVNQREDADWYVRRGSNSNLILRNDVSYALSHGAEILFGFDTQIVDNRIVGNGISGVSAAFSHESLIARNIIEENGRARRDDQDGGVNIASGEGSRIQENVFRRNPVGVRLWARSDHPVIQLPWAQVNGFASANNTIVHNDFVQDTLITELKSTTGTIFGRNALLYVSGFVVGDETSMEHLGRPPRDLRIDRDERTDVSISGNASPVGGRAPLRGGHWIAMTEWGPRDWSAEPVLVAEVHPGKRIFHARQPITGWQIDSDRAAVEHDSDAHTLTVQAEPGHVVSFTLDVALDDDVFEYSGTLIGSEWTIRVFMAHSDPRDDVEQWRSFAEFGQEFSLPGLHLPYGYAGPSQLAAAPPHVRDLGFATDRFGTFAETELTLPEGVWRVRAKASDGVRVWIDDDVVIDDWQAGPDRIGQPATHSHEFAVDRERTVNLRVEHFEIEGYALLRIDIEPADTSP